MKITTGPRAIYIPADGSLEIGSATGCLFTGDIPREFLKWDKDRRKRIADDERLRREAERTMIAAARTEAESLRKETVRLERRISAKNEVIMGLSVLLGLTVVIAIFAVAVA